MLNFDGADVECDDTLHTDAVTADTNLEDDEYMASKGADAGEA
jgi:hypothetical protein